MNPEYGLNLEWEIKTYGFTRGKQIVVTGNDFDLDNKLMAQVLTASYNKDRKHGALKQIHADITGRRGKGDSLLNQGSKITEEECYN